MGIVEMAVLTVIFVGLLGLIIYVARYARRDDQ